MLMLLLVILFGDYVFDYGSDTCKICSASLKISKVTEIGGAAKLTILVLVRRFLSLLNPQIE